MIVMTAFIAWLATTIGLGITSLMVPGIKMKTFGSFLIAAAVLSLVNASIRPVLWFLTAPLSVVTLGLFTLIINALMIMLTAAIVPGFEIKGFGSAFLGAIIMALIGMIGFITLPLLSGADITWSSYEFHSQGIQ